MDYESIKRLGLDHYNVDSNQSYETFDPSTNNHTIHLYLNKDYDMKCPKCGSSNIMNKGTRNITIKYASALEDNITIYFHCRRFRCLDCNSYFQEVNPFNFKNKSTAIQKEIKIIQEFKNKTITYSEVAEKYHVSNTYVMNLFDQKVNISRNTLTQVVCLDEVYTKRLTKYSYCFVIYSPQRKMILDILDSRHMVDISNYFRNIPLNEREGVKYISIDLYDNYRIVAKKYFPKAKIVADSFHVIKNMMAYFDHIRIRVMKKYEHLKKQNDNYYWLYKKYANLLHKSYHELGTKTVYIGKTKQVMRQRQVVDYMLTIDEELKLAHELKESYLVFNSTATNLNAKEWLDELILNFQNSNIPEYVSFWKLLKNWYQEILNSFDRLNGYRISNGPIERVNKDIKIILNKSFGSTNFARMRNRIMYCINSNATISYQRNSSNKKVGKPRGSYKK